MTHSVCALFAKLRRAEDVSLVLEKQYGETTSQRASSGIWTRHNSVKGLRSELLQHVNLEVAISVLPCDEDCASLVFRIATEAATYSRLAGVLPLGRADKLTSLW